MVTITAGFDQDGGGTMFGCTAQMGLVSYAQQLAHTFIRNREQHGTARLIQPRKLSNMREMMGLTQANRFKIDAYRLRENR